MKSGKDRKYKRKRNHIYKSLWHNLSTSIRIDIERTKIFMNSIFPSKHKRRKQKRYGVGVPSGSCYDTYTKSEREEKGIS